MVTVGSHPGDRRREHRANHSSRSKWQTFSLDDLSTVIDNIEAGYISRSKIHGFGLFAESDLPAGKQLCTLDGQVVPWALHQSEQLTSEWNALSGSQFLVRPYRTKYFYINHSRQPNLVIKHRGDAPIVVVARSIAKDEEMTLDYREEPLSDDYIAAHGHTYL
ncbi:SET domain-containing protein [Hydrocarboniclastica marina]|uniref:SET domain-containing protein n=1 Tax=Hydrocarboniclastica marina TaxID=2259620 RepID=A0A4P7XJH6_9ALTE|nr:SET domain-containing protein [Hydrocarboniclastica marina]